MAGVPDGLEAATAEFGEGTRPADDAVDVGKAAPHDAAFGRCAAEKTWTCQRPG